MNAAQLSEVYALDMDRADALARFRKRFYIPENMIYMDGNSLGLMSMDAEESLLRVMNEWKTKAIGGWLEANPPWFYLAEKLGATASSLVGALPEETICAGTTTVNIHSLVSSFYQPAGNRTKILADGLNFPSDIYALKGQIQVKGLAWENHLVLVPSADGRTLDEDTIIEHMTAEIAVAFFPSVLYRSGQLLDMEKLTVAAHRKGILIGFDCCHSAGVVPHEFSKWGVDFALWCSYKYMNAGPGAPAFLYVNQKHFDKQPVLAGWFGSNKEKQFDMSLEFTRAGHAGGWQISTPCVLSMAPIEGALNIIHEAGIDALREKSMQLTSYFIDLKEALLPEEEYHLIIGTPRDKRRRSGHVSIEGGPELWQIQQALKAHRIIPDFRPPGLIRFAPVPLYNTFHDVWKTVYTLKTIIDTKEYEAFNKEKSSVT